MGSSDALYRTWLDLPMVLQTNYLIKEEMIRHFSNTLFNIMRGGIFDNDLSD